MEFENACLIKNIPLEFYFDYLETLKKKIYRLLLSYEDGVNNNDFSDLLVNLNYLQMQMLGSSFLFVDTVFVEALSMIIGIEKNIEIINHKQIKSAILKICNKIQRIQTSIERGV